jgi:U4/U6.U5 tri-snRNP-associated protein 2
MAKTRGKRTANTIEPPSPAEPTKRRQSKRAKKTESEVALEPEPVPAPVAEPEPLPAELSPEPGPEKEAMTEPTHVETPDISIDDEQEEGDHIDEPTEEPRASDLYLDTVSPSTTFCPPPFSTLLLQIDRAVLDFDFEKVCSVSTLNFNIYGCLVCGKYFQGRGRKSHAYAHSIHDDHHVFINLETTKVRIPLSLLQYTDPSDLS